ncbi:MAG: Eco47II family restriction endonuclease [Clostridiales bacterium]|jgi:hypothetical protein|nr:Eco47II family restriction endonuclease [Clostridiales bacterium]
MRELTFISERDFKEHIRLTIKEYGEKLAPYSLSKFNRNIVDPIKLVFDKAVYRYSWEEIVKNEILRQRDKSNNNDIGYFHQRIFNYIQNCKVPAAGWDVIYQKETGIGLPDGDKVKTVFVEMKNKHNTMNSSSGQKTYMKMQNKLLSDDDCACFLVEAIAKKSQNIAWQISLDGETKKHRRIRRVSMDEFYGLVTGRKDAFCQMCLALPAAIEEVIETSGGRLAPQDTVIEELKGIAAQEKNGSFALALYMLGFRSYFGFRKP